MKPPSGTDLIMDLADDPDITPEMRQALLNIYRDYKSLEERVNGLARALAATRSQGVGHPDYPYIGPMLMETAPPEDQ